MAIHLGLKLAILRSGQTQRDISAATHIAETRLSNIVRGRATPRSDERAALATVLGQDLFVEHPQPDDVGEKR